MTLRALPRIERLHLADLVLPEGHPAAVGDRRCRVFGFVVDHPDGAILVDTGVGTGSDVIDDVYSPTVVDLESTLLSVGVEPDRVVMVVNSHLHFDHCGQNPLFYGSGRPVLVQADEVAAARADPFYTVPEWATVPDGQLRSVRGDETVAEGVRLLATPGHTWGHQSVMVEAEDGRVVIAAQAVWQLAEFADEMASDANVDDAALRDAAVSSIRRLKALEPEATYFSHDSEVFRPSG